MKAYRMHAISTSQLDDVEDPQMLSGDVMVAPEAAGVCGTDLHVLHEGVFIDFDNGLPVTMGHEVIGRVIDIPKTNSDLYLPSDGLGPIRVGDRVVAEPVLNCGRCAKCLRGFPNLCSKWSHLGFLRDGVWAEKVAIPTSRLTRIPEHVNSVHGVLAEPVACALHFLKRAEMAPGQHVVVIGGGPAGQLTMLCALAAGAASVVLSDPIEARRELAHSIGATGVIDPTTTDIHEFVLDITRGAGADVVIEIAGVPNAVTQAVTLPRKGGTLVLAGICGAKSTSIDTNRIVNDEITVRGAFATRWQMSAAVNLIASGSLDVSPIVSEVLDWTQAGKAMEMMYTRTDLCKVVLTF
jgi:2-desacetyl-2-hydroxyethyl bacteriochlorophyllide A dehydrogenase